MATTRKAPRALNKPAAEIRANATAEKARKAASKAALKATNPAANHPKPEPLEHMSVDPIYTDEQNDAHEAAIHADAISILGADATKDQIDAYVKDNLEPVVPKARYSGPMSALKTARAAYVKGSNGNPHTADKVGHIFGSLKREQVVAICIEALGLPTNPYTSLNPGQQSMNLRNKLRHAMKIGFVTEVQIAVLIGKYADRRVNPTAPALK